MIANATLIIDLEQYPTSTPAIYQVNLTYRACLPVNFEGLDLEDQVLTVGQSGSDLIANFDQYPCLYRQDYSFFCFDHETGSEIEVPSFII